MGDRVQKTIELKFHCLVPLSLHHFTWKEGRGVEGRGEGRKGEGREGRGEGRKGEGREGRGERREREEKGEGREGREREEKGREGKKNWWELQV